MKDKLTPKVVAALAAAAVAAVALIGWFGLVSPQRSKAAEPRQPDRRRADPARRRSRPRRRPAGRAKVARPPAVLTRAMPQSVAMSTVLRQLQRAARQAGVRLDSVTPQACDRAAGLLTVSDGRRRHGRYFAVQRFLKRLRMQAGVSGHGVHASGRLFSVDSVSLAADEAQLPQLAATIHSTSSPTAVRPARRPRPRPTATPSLRDCRRRDALMTVIETHVAAAAGRPQRRGDAQEDRSRRPRDRAPRAARLPAAEAHEVARVSPRAPPRPPSSRRPPRLVLSGRARRSRLRTQAPAPDPADGAPRTRSCRSSARARATSSSASTRLRRSPSAAPSASSAAPAGT